ncbi:heat shock 70 kDa protein 12A-like isoform X2 [Ruditapes philippinarum]|nr:heat shock 70 kDa protein 12A-like isoform X2 [Ruditapes philippinarum]XP_060601652.1 heat shock 70 kDa protein 12A-like isoform X2 [Ruditapes philippinarum]XP_060601653.1 heat shock 70 kDa protein 12A-like isoform X2 [Ruditapes philippinarum]XP_060601654.1 heat shock 70 kDa protein 12A-like isoform X2 [Ruditapes philippinarum]
MTSRQDILLVVAIDFGTTYSGFAIQFRHEFDPKDPTKIRAPQAWNGGKQNLMSYKTPTCLLLKEDKTIESFGFEAEEKYADLCMNKENKKFYYYRQFKMKLQEGQGLKKGSLLEDETQKTMPALEVFALSIQCLKDCLMKLVESQGTGVGMDDILWVLTVPAIWDDNAKAFMKEAAKLAGISENRLSIALEPEVASLFCQHLPVEKFSEGGKAGFANAKPGTTYMVADLGGGTADITVHERLSGNRIKEVYKASGGPWGGTAVDHAFTQLIVSIVGGPVWGRFKREQTYDHLELLKDFECIKRTLGTKTGEWYNIKIPATLNEVCKEVHDQSFQEMTQESPIADQIAFVSDKMRMKVGLVEKLFKKVIDNIVEHMKRIITTTDAGRKISLILMVGGFSESPFVQQVMKAEFTDKSKVKVLIPQQAGIAVLNGAVLYGRMPEVVTTRVVRYTYGVRVRRKFQPGKDPESKKKQNKPEYCYDAFKPFMKEGTSVERGHKVIQSYSTSRPFQEDMDVYVYTAAGFVPEFVTDNGCHLLGILKVKVPDPSEKERNLVVLFRFGSTTLAMLAIEEDSKKVCATVFGLPE